MLNLNKEELAVLKKLNTPRKIQHFLNQIPINFEKKGETCLSPRKVLKENKAHCIEGAILAALALKLQGYKPLIVNLITVPSDEDHVIAVFKQNGCWGAISKTNHAVLRYRDPIYKSVRELVMSYFHEYFDKKGKKTLRAYTQPLDLSIFDQKNWATSEENLWYIDKYLDKIPRFSILNKSQLALLKKPDEVEMKYGEIVEWKKR